MFKRAEIWKIQRPLFTNEAPPMVMAYTEDKVKMAMIPMGEELIDEIFGDEPKLYVRATVKNGVLKISEIVEEQEW